MTIDFDAMARDHESEVAARRADPRPIVHVVNCHSPIRDWPVKSWHYVGKLLPRSLNYRGSVLSMENAGVRTLEAYRAWLTERTKDATGGEWYELMQILGYSLDLRGIALGCWCAPGPCHADVVKEFVEQMWEYGWRPPGWSVEAIR